MVRREPLRRNLAGAAAGHVRPVGPNHVAAVVVEPVGCALGSSAGHDVYLADTVGEPADLQAELAWLFGQDRG